MAYQLQIIRNETHAQVIIRGENGHNVYALLRRDVTPKSREVKRLIKQLEALT